MYTRSPQPGDTPFERASRFGLAVNPDAAGSLGQEIPQSILLRADRVIE